MFQNKNILMEENTSVCSFICFSCSRRFISLLMLAKGQEEKFPTLKSLRDEKWCAENDFIDIVKEYLLNPFQLFFNKVFSPE